MNFFYVIYLTDPVLETCIDAIRLLLNPQEKRPAHLTVRGPYAQKLSKLVVERISTKIEGSSIRITGVDSFFATNQNTVMFKCVSPRLLDVWHKPDYEFNPHITIYDGDSRQIAAQLLRTLSKYSYNVLFTASKLFQIASSKGQEKLIVRMNLDTGLLEKITGYRIRLREIDRMDKLWRFFLIDRIASYMSTLWSKEDFRPGRIEHVSKQFPRVNNRPSP